MRYHTVTDQPQWAQVTGQAVAPILAGDMEPYIVEPGARLQVGRRGLYETMGATVDHARAPRQGVTTLMHVGHDGLGLELGPDIGATARTAGWAAAAVWAYAKWVKKDPDLAKKALPFAIGGWALGFLVR
jgi:hypothetical protein